MSEIVVRDLYLRITDKNGKSHIECRRVWDGERFFASILEQVKKEGGAVVASNRDAYLAERRAERQA